MSMYHRTRRERGFTLIEVVIVIAITSLMIVALTDLIKGFYVTYRRQATAVNVDTSASMIMSETRAAVLQADHVLSSHIFSGVSRASSSTALVVEVPAIDASGDIIAGTYDYIGIYASGTDAYRVSDVAAGSVRASGTKHLSDVLSALTFTYNTVDITQATSTSVDVVTQATSTNESMSRHLYEQIYVRNL